MTMTTTTTTRERRENIQRVVVVFEGHRLTSDKTYMALLWRASNYASNMEDEILVLALLSIDGSAAPSSSNGFHGDDQFNVTCEGNPFVTFLRQEISQRKEAYRRIFRPFHEFFKSRGVKFQVKIAAGFKPEDIITEEANNAGANWIILDSSIARYLTFRLSGTESNVSLVSEKEGDVGVFGRLFPVEEPESSILMEAAHNLKSQEPIKASKSQVKQSICDRASTSRETYEETIESRRQVEQTRTCSNIHSSNNISRVSLPGFMLEKPHKLSWEVILQITKGFSTKAWNNDPDRNYSTHVGYFQNQPVLVQRLLSCSRRILDAEMKAALSMHHRNIMILTGYHRSKNGTILIFPFPQGMTSIDKYIWGSRRRELEFQAKLEIAISIAQGLRYMHDECPNGPIVHGDLQPRKIFVGRDFQPMISGFGKAKWFQLELQESLNSGNRSLVMDASVHVHESMALVKSDVLQFGVLLLRLFCKTSVPEDDKSLIEWARPLMSKGKFHELLGADSNFSDMHGIYRVMATATACTKSKPSSRPDMTQVISILKGEKFCAMQTSPSDNNF